MSPILFEIEDKVAYIRFNRPDKLNAFNRSMALEFQSVLDQCSRNTEVRCLYITGAGKGFSAGQDLSEVLDSKGPGMELILKEQYNPIITRIRKIAKPVIAAVNGVAAGAGVNIALACDIVVAAHSASFIQAFSKIALVPDSGGTFFLPRLIGFQKASALMLLGDKISASEAEKLGMLYKVFEDHLFETESRKMATTLASMPTLSLGFIKNALNETFHHTLDQQLALEDELQQKAAASYDFKEGVKAFIEKRKPDFQGK